MENYILNPHELININQGAARAGKQCDLTVQGPLVQHTVLLCTQVQVLMLSEITRKEKIIVSSVWKEYFK